MGYLFRGLCLLLAVGTIVPAGALDLCLCDASGPGWFCPEGDRPCETECGPAACPIQTQPSDPESCDCCPVLVLDRSPVASPAPDSLLSASGPDAAPAAFVAAGLADLESERASRATRISTPTRLSRLHLLLSIMRC